MRNIHASSFVKYLLYIHTITSSGDSLATQRRSRDFFIRAKNETISELFNDSYIPHSVLHIYSRIARFVVVVSVHAAFTIFAMPRKRKVNKLYGDFYFFEKGQMSKREEKLHFRFLKIDYKQVALVFVSDTAKI